MQLNPFTLVYVYNSMVKTVKELQSLISELEVTSDRFSVLLQLSLDGLQRLKKKHALMLRNVKHDISCCSSKETCACTTPFLKCQPVISDPLVDPLVPNECALMTCSLATRQVVLCDGCTLRALRIEVFAKWIPDEEKLLQELLSKFSSNHHHP